MADPPIQTWLKRLGYSDEPHALHLRDTAPSHAHPHALEIDTLLKPDGDVRAHAVFDVERVPTVVFLGADNEPLSSEARDKARKRIWNQNLATVVIDVQGDQALALPTRKLQTEGEILFLDQARPDGPFSAFDVASANLPRRAPSWFDLKARVDHKLLANLSATVTELRTRGFDGTEDEKERRLLAELLMGEVLFVSYLEHRRIIGTTYRQRHKVDPLHTLVEDRNRHGIKALIDRLRLDFNGDFLGDDGHSPWAALASDGFDLVNQFLRRTDMQTGQEDFWNYDFSYIPVELLSGLYESFLSPQEQEKEGSYYTPRNLAMLAVDQAFANSPDPLSDTIFDGACGSGILLTTAYRRLIALSEERIGRQLSFAERGELLTQHIFGGDINFMACRVTAFSLYLSLLEGLEPSDIMEAKEKDGVTLPSLNGTNLAYGSNAADLFNESHAFNGRRFSLVISNPPWAEPSGTDWTSADEWCQQTDVPFVRRQMAGAFALRALDFVADHGRVCLILPIALLLGPSSSRFVSAFLTRCRPSRLINFGDLQGLLFPTAENTCHVFLGVRRGEHTRIPFQETFEYCVPKADMSLALGRLTMQSADFHRLQTGSVVDDPQLLVAMMWGDANDLAIWTRLTARGTFANFWKARHDSGKWIFRKGIHLNDKSRPAVSAEPLRRIPHVPIAAFKVGSPVLQPDHLTNWPEHHNEVVGLNDATLHVFDGPRVVFSDGFAKSDQNIRAVYYDGPATFTNSIGVISSRRKEDASLLKFATVYLRSSLARYFLMMRGWKMLCERNGLHIADVKTFPFFEPKSAPDPEAAERALMAACEYMDRFSFRDQREVQNHHILNRELDSLVFEYFALTPEEQVLVRETVTILMPSIRPRTFKSLDTPAQKKAQQDDFIAYARALADSLTSWRTRMQGRGRFHVGVVTSDPIRAGSSGIVRVNCSADSNDSPLTEVTVNDDLVLETLVQLRHAGLHAIPSGESLSLVPDTHIWVGQSLYLVRPLTKRSWTVRQALRDAEQIVRLSQPTA